jgi:NAD(P) transhydrogenase subunit alpha
LLVLGNLPADAGWGVRIICFVALVFGTLNVIGGFLVTDRMLGMFKSKKKELTEPKASASSKELAK